MTCSIAIIVPELLPVPPSQGGAVEHWVDEISQRMVSPNRKLAIISRPAGVKGHEGIEYISIPWTPSEKFFHRLKERFTWKNPLRYLAKIQNVYSYGKRVATAVQDFDIIYLHNEPNILFFLQKRANQKIVLHMHNDHLSMRLFRPFYRKILAKADKIICVSDYIKSQAVVHFPEYSKRFQVIFNSTDPKIFKPYGDEALHQLKDVIPIEPSTQYLLYIGRLTALKGVHILIKAFLEVHQQLPNVKLIIIGSSFFGEAAKTAYEQELITLAAPVCDAIIFTGFLPHEKLKYLYSIADIVALPSIWQDPCPLVVLETMASETCLISSAVGGVPEILEHEKNGILIKPNDAKALTMAILNTLKKPEKMRQMEVAARKKIISGYTWTRLVSELNTLFEALK